MKMKSQGEGDEIAGSEIEMKSSWGRDEIKVEGGTTKDPLTFYYRDGLDCFKFLLANPLLADYMDYTPRREYANEDKSKWLYNEMMTGDLAWNLQVRILALIVR